MKLLFDNGTPAPLRRHLKKRSQAVAQAAVVYPQGER